MEFSGRFALTLEPARIEWRGDQKDEPWAVNYEDVYYMPGHGEAESRAVFLEGNHLAERSREPVNTAILETGFGTGLNFLLSADLFSDSPGFLHYVSFEKHPLSPADLARALARYPASSAKTALLAHYPPLVPGFHTIEIGSNILLTLVFGDALEMIPLLCGKVDAFFLDGFAPARNGELWSLELFVHLARLARPGATLATFTAAGSVRRALSEAGFEVSKVPGFGSKREMIRASMPLNADGAPARIRSAAVVGAGIAGASLARALSRRGINVTLFEKEAPASGASGNAYGIFQPVLAAQRTAWSRWTRAGFWYLQSLGLLEQVPHRKGLFQVAGDAGEEKRLLAGTGLAGTGEMLSSDEAARRKLPRAPGVYFDRAGFVSPPALVKALIRASGARVVTRAVDRITLEAEHVTLETNQSRESFDVCALCLGSDLPDLLTASSLAIDATFEIVRGQVNYLPAGAVESSDVLCDEGYVIAAPDLVVAGSTYDRKSRDRHITQEDQKIILGLLDRIIPNASLPYAEKNLPGRASLRIAGTDHLPLFGRLAGQRLFVSTAHGSRGILSAPLAAEIIAAEAADGVCPVESDLAEFFSSRFTERKQRRAEKARPHAKKPKPS